MANSSYERKRLDLLAASERHIKASAALAVASQRTDDQPGFERARLLQQAAEDALVSAALELGAWHLIQDSEVLRASCEVVELAVDDGGAMTIIKAIRSLAEATEALGGNHAMVSHTAEREAAMIELGATNLGPGHDGREHLEVYIGGVAVWMILPRHD